MSRRARALALAALALALVGLWLTSPSRVFPECQGTKVPRHCVD